MGEETNLLPRCQEEERWAEGVGGGLGAVEGSDTLSRVDQRAGDGHH